MKISNKNRKTRIISFTLALIMLLQILLPTLSVEAKNIDLKNEINNSMNTNGINSSYQASLKLIIRDKNDENIKLQGAGFTLTGNAYNQTKLSDNLGELTFTNIPVGSYTLRQTQSQDDYVADTNKSWEVKVDEVGRVFIDGVQYGSPPIGSQVSSGWQIHEYTPGELTTASRVDANLDTGDFIYYIHLNLNQVTSKMTGTPWFNLHDYDILAYYKSDSQASTSSYFTERNQVNFYRVDPSLTGLLTDLNLSDTSKFTKFNRSPSNELSVKPNSKNNHWSTALSANDFKGNGSKSVIVEVKGKIGPENRIRLSHKFYYGSKLAGYGKQGTYNFGTIDYRLPSPSPGVMPTLTISNEKGSQAITPVPTDYPVKINVKGENNKPVQGAIFTLTNKTDSSKVYTATSNINGLVDFGRVALGAYSLKNTNAPDSYINRTDIDLSMTYNGSLKDVEASWSSSDSAGVSFAKENGQYIGNISLQKDISRGQNNNLENKLFNIKSKVTFSNVAGPLLSHQKIYLYLDEKLTVNDPSTLKDLYDDQGTKVFSASYDAANNRIVYTPATYRYNKTYTFDINQDVNYNTSKIPAESNFTVVNKITGIGLTDPKPLPAVELDKNGNIIGGNIIGGGELGSSSYPYELEYYSYQYYKDGLVNWDIIVDTSALKDANLDFSKLSLSIYGSSKQGLSNYKVSVENAGPVKITDSSNSDLNIFTGQIDKENLANGNIRIKVSASPEIRSDSFSIGLRITPDKNYIKTLLDQYRDRLDELKAAIPWIIPILDEGRTGEFINGFNLVDTRLSADLRNLNIYSNTNEILNPYNDHTRSVVARRNTNKNGADWQISDLITREDIKNGYKIANIDDIKTYVKTYSVETPISTNAKSLVYYIPNPDGTYRQSTTYEPVPGTIAVYNVSTNRGSNPSNISMIKVPFSDGEKIAYLSWPTDANTNYSRIALFDYTDVRQINHFKVMETGLDAFCINYRYNNPVAVTNKPVPEIVTSGSQIRERLIKDLITQIHGKTSPYYSPDNTEFENDLLDYIKRVFYYRDKMIEDKKLDIINDERVRTNLFQVVQGVIFDIVSNDGDKFIKDMNTFIDVDRNLKTVVDPKIYELKAELKNLVESGPGWDNSMQEHVHLYIFPQTGMDQNVISAYVDKPVKIEKLDISTNNPLAGAEFEIQDLSGHRVAGFKSESIAKDLYLKPGTYKLVELRSPIGYQKIKPITFVVEEQVLNNPITVFRKAGYNDAKYKINEPYRSMAIRIIDDGNNYIQNKNGIKNLILKDADSQDKLIIGNYKPPIDLRIKKVNQEDKALQGAEFTLYKENGLEKVLIEGKEVIAVSQTDGYAVFRNLQTGIYVIKESKTPSGYKKTDQIWKIRVDEDGKIYLYDSQTGKFVNLPLADGSQEVVLKIINYKNELGKFTIDKKKQDGRTPLADAEFTLSKMPKASLPATFTNITKITDNAGNVTFENLEPGLYILEETKSPLGYIRDERRFVVIVQENGNTILVREKNYDPSIHKVELDQKGRGNTTIVPKPGLRKIPKSLDGQIELLSYSLLTPNNSGEIKYNQAENLYMEMELKLPEDVIPGDTFTIEIDPKLNFHGVGLAESETMPDITNAFGKQIAVSNEKVLENGVSRKKATYTLTDYVVDRTDIRIRFRLPVYIDPDYYKVDTVSSFTNRIARNEKTTDNIVVNFDTVFHRKWDYYDFRGSDYWGSPVYYNQRDRYLQGVDSALGSKLFVDTDKHEAIVYIYVFGHRNTLSNSNSLTIWARDRNWGANTSLQFIEGKTTYQVYKVDNPFTSWNYWSKVGEINTNLFPQSFSEKLMDTSKPVSKVSTLSRDNLRIDLGSEDKNFGYIVKLTTPYDPQSQNPIEVHSTLNSKYNVSYGGGARYDSYEQRLDFYNYLKIFDASSDGISQPLFALELEKVNEAGRPLQGAIFRLFDGKGFEDQMKTDQYGKIHFDGLKAGDYFLEELLAPKGHKLPTSIWKINIKQDGTISILENPDQLLSLSGKIIKVKNLAMDIEHPTQKLINRTNRVVFEKRGELGQILTSGRFELRKGTDIIATKTPNAQGQIIFEKLSPGNYSLWEIEAPEGYKKPSQALVKFTVDESGNIEGLGDPEMPTVITNEKIQPMPIRILKKDGQGSPIHEGIVKYKLERAASNTEGAQVPTELVNGIDLNNIELNLAQSSIINITLPADFKGEYILKEIQAPIGYTKSFNNYHIFIDPQRGQVILTKLTNNLGGEVEYLDRGKLTQSSEKIYLYSQDNTVQDVLLEIVNHKAEYPKTGGIGSIIFNITGGVLMAIAYIELKRNKKIYNFKGGEAD
ncbi:MULTISPECIES: SpaA isopeptide-forming pilin-related protein [Helcococcus]|uniref:SpaA isopeptide-forming pilin-related protein n=1 Tax=Helcococcus bovis TaxID=3153252 RepID=A0ABW9F6J5_9FIRM